MNSVKQILRQPLRFLLGTMLVTLAVAVMCVCLGQGFMAAGMRSTFNKNYLTVGVVTPSHQNYKFDTYGKILSISPAQRSLDWLDELTTQHPELVIADSRPSLSSASISSLTPLLQDVFKDPKYPYSDSLYVDNEKPDEAYRSVMLEVEVTGIIRHMNSDKTVDHFTFSGTIVRALSCSQARQDPTGLAFSLTLTGVPGETSFTTGRYLLYATDCEYEEMAETFCNLTIDASAAGEGVYQLPTIARLSGTVEEFLASEEGRLWRSALQQDKVNHHAFPIVGVSNLSYIGQFARQQAEVVFGRSFTAQEVESGAKVCIISRQLAEANGLAVGDTIDAQYFSLDENHPKQQLLSQGHNLINPAAAWFGPESLLEQQAVQYTIVGIYYQRSPWSDPSVDATAFTPNTIFVPTTALGGEIQQGEMCFFRTIVVHTNAKNKVITLAAAAKLPLLLDFSDQGYSKMLQLMGQYDDIALQALQTGVLVYGMLMLLFTLLFPCRERKNLHTMASMGAQRYQQHGHLMRHSLAMLVPGTVLGTVAGLLLRDKLMELLVDTGENALTQITAEALLLASVTQLAVISVVIALAVIPLTRQKSLMNRKQTRAVKTKRKTLHKTPFSTYSVLAFALVIAITTCSLEYSNRREAENLANTKENMPVTVVLNGLKNTDDVMYYIPDWLLEEFLPDRTTGILDYLENVDLWQTSSISSINGKENDYLSHNAVFYTLCGINSMASEPITKEFTPGIIWAEGYDESIFQSYDDVILVPRRLMDEFGLKLEDNPTVWIFHKGHSISTDSSGNVSQKEYYSWEKEMRIVGTYPGSAKSPYIFCSYYKVLEIEEYTFGSASGMATEIKATLKDYDQLDEFRSKTVELLKQHPECKSPEDGGDFFWYYTPKLDEATGNILLHFSDPSFGSSFIFTIDSTAIEKAASILQSSIRMNQICTLAIFLLTAGAGFFLGFLMIRNRRRDILLMRTLGKANLSIYWDFAMEQMKYLLVGIAIGGVIFLWQPLNKLGIFAGIYFVGMSAALLVFLNSKLISGTKDEE